MSNIKKLIVDGETLLNRWEGLSELTDTNIYVSFSNYILCMGLVAESLKFLDKYPDKKEEFIDAHYGIISVISNDEIMEAVSVFADTTDPYLNTISINGEEQNLNLIIYKGVALEKSEGDEIDPTIDETVAYAVYKKSQGEPVPVFTMNEDIIAFIKEFEFDLDVIDVVEV